jgi:hypothetical protein
MLKNHFYTRSSMKILAMMLAVIVSVAFVQSTRAEDPAKGTGSIKGTVLGMDGKPAANVEVRLIQPRRGPATRPAATPNVAVSAQPKEPAERHAPGAGGSKAPMPAPLKTATTDADGAFSMADVAPGNYVVVAGSPEMGVGRARVVVKDGEAATVEIKLATRQPPQ